MKYYAYESVAQTIKHKPGAGPESFNNFIKRLYYNII